MLNILIMVLCAILWSLVGIFVKLASDMVDSSTITFCRFFIGGAILAWLMWLKQRRVRIERNDRWIWYGAFGKSGNYFFENIGIFLGLSYGYIIATPISTVFLLLVIAFVFQEQVRRLDWAAAALCILGVFLVNWNGRSLGEMFGENGFITLLFVLSAIGYSFHFLSQKKLVARMDSISMNLSVFAWSALITAVPLPFQFEFKGWAGYGPFLALLALGAITGLSFYLFSLALRTVPFFLAVIITNGSVMFTVLWGYLFFDEPVSMYIVSGVVLFVIGMIAANWPKKPAASASGATLRTSQEGTASQAAQE